VRDIISDVTLTAHDLILPVFVRDESISPTIEAMPGVARYTLEELKPLSAKIAGSGIGAIALFPVVEPALKCPEGKEALNPDNLVCRAIQTIKQAAPQIGVIADVALDPYTTHGHDGLLVEGAVANDATVAILAQQALTLAQAGADVVAPSDMMDGRVRAIRRGLDLGGYTRVMIWSYGAKFASAFYGPFRNALQVKALGGALDKKSYQLDSRTPSQALQKIAQDITEGADAIIIKPGVPYMDILQQAKSRWDVPLISYHVSGEYAMLKAAAAKGWLDYNQTLMETLIALKRAGASAIITYGALDAAMQVS
jgi:porphobilinogen synthase